MTTVVFLDKQNIDHGVIDDEYAQTLIEEFRRQTGWKVLPDTPIYDDLREFSKGYSKTKRNVSEVAYIFRIAVGIQ